MTASEYAQKVLEVVEARPGRVDLDRLIYEVYVRAKIAEARRDQKQGRWRAHKQAMEAMWKRIGSKSVGRGGPKKTSRRSSTRSPKKRH